LGMRGCLQVVRRMCGPATQFGHPSKISAFPIVFLPQWYAASTSTPRRCTAGRSCRRCPRMRGQQLQSAPSSMGLGGCLASSTSSYSGLAGEGRRFLVGWPLTWWHGSWCCLGMASGPWILPRHLWPRLAAPPVLSPALVPACSFTAVADSDSSAWCIDRRAFESMAASDPASLVLLETIVLRSTCLSAAHALEALERSSSAD